MIALALALALPMQAAPVVTKQAAPVVTKQAAPVVTKQAAPAMVVVDETATKVREAPPHGKLGMSTAWRITDAVPDRIMEFRRRELDKGAAIGVHPIAHDEVYYVVSGEGDVVSDGVTRRLRPGLTAYLFEGAHVGIQQVGDAPLSLVIAYPLKTRVR